MKNDAYIIGVPEVTAEEVAELFEFHLPSEHSGYVRSLRLVELEQIEVLEEEAINAQYGYFSSTGEFTYWGDTEEELFRDVQAKGIEVHYVH